MEHQPQKHDAKTALQGADAVAQAAAELARGSTAAFPTDTFYALGANALDANAVERVFRLKGRSDGKPLPVFIASARLLHSVAPAAPAIARRLADAFWPGPLTLVLPAAAGLPANLLAQGRTVGVRVPGHPLALRLLQAVPFPVTATSANASGTPPPKSAAEVRRSLGPQCGYIIEGQCGSQDAPSTVLDLSGAHPALLRPGAIPPARLAAAAPELEPHITAGEPRP